VQSIKGYGRTLWAKNDQYCSIYGSASFNKAYGYHIVIILSLMGIEMPFLKNFKRYLESSQTLLSIHGKKRGS